MEPEVLSAEQLAARVAEKDEHYEECWEEFIRGFRCSCAAINAEEEAYYAEPPDMAARENGFIT